MIQGVILEQYEYYAYIAVIFFDQVDFGLWIQTGRA